MITKQVVRIVQLITIIPARVLLSVIIKSSHDRLLKDHITRNGKYVLVANHSGALDPIVICYSFKFLLSASLTPWRFFVSNKFFNNVFFLPVLYLFGCFRARQEQHRKSGLKYALRLIDNNQNLVIFPEGKVSKFDERILPHTGVETLANYGDVQLIPARVRWNRQKGLWKSYSLAIGKPFSGKNMTAEQIMDVVYSLKFR